MVSLRPRRAAPPAEEREGGSAHLAVTGVSKRFGAVAAVDGVSLDIARGEFFALLGPSGCGKTTLLRLLAGFETPDGGTIRLDGADLTALPPYRRPVNMMFQSYALFPHMTVAGNVAFGLRQERVKRTEIAARVAEALALVELSPLARRKPHQLSGGQQQRVALARSLVKRPRLLLLDEPLAALDRKLREQTQFELMAIQRRIGITFVIVTHDQDEAMTVADRIAVMDRGRIVQVAGPAEIYEAPRSRYVAEFIGAVNIFEGRARQVGADAVAIDLPEAPAGLAAPAPAERPARGDAVLLAVRPEKIEIAPEPPPGADTPSADTPGANNVMAGVVAEIAYLGSTSTYRVRLDSGKTVAAVRTNRLDRAGGAIGRGARVHLSWPREAGFLLRG